MERNRFRSLTFVNSSMICLFIVIFSSVQQVSKAQTTFTSVNPNIVHYCPDGWVIFQRSARCVKLVSDIPSTTGLAEGITWNDAKDVCESEGARLLRFEVFGTRGYNVNGVEIAPTTDLAQLYSWLNDQDIPCVWTGMFYGEDDMPRWSTGERAYEDEGFWGGRDEPHAGARLSVRHKFQRAVATCRGPLNRYFYQYGYRPVNIYKKLPALCEMRAPLENHLPCVNLKRVPDSSTCDDINDCGDNSDEQDCPTKDRQIIHLESTQQVVRTAGSTYQANLQAEWLIKALPGVAIEGTMDRFATEEHTDFASIQIGGRTVSQLDSPPLAQLSGMPELQSYYSYNNYMYVAFSSDSSGTDDGFSMTVRPVYTNDQWEATVDEDGTLTGIGGMTECTDTSWLRPGLRYVWKFTAPDSSLLTLQFAGLELCEGSFLEIRDGPVSESALLARYDGGVVSERLVVMSTRAQMYVYLHTGDAVCKGGCIDFTIADGCVADLSTMATEITSPGYQAYTPGRYPDYVVCRYYLMTPKTATASVKFIDFDMYDTNDFIRIYPMHVPRANETTAVSLVNLTKGDDADTYGVGEGKMTVIFNSSTIGNVARGFSFVFAQNCEYPDFNNDTYAEGSQNLGNGATLTVKCKEDGYFFAQEEHYLVEPLTTGVLMTCNRSRWDVRATPNCERRWCGFIPHTIDVNAFVDIGESTQLGYSIGIREDDRLSFACFVGGIESGNPLTCQLDGTWLNNPTCGDVKCTLPANPPDFGNFSILNAMDDVTGYDGERIGSILGYTCDMGYVITDGPNSFCTNGGTYSVTGIMCEPKRCPLLDIENGDWLASEVFIETPVKFTCRAGYEYVDGGTSIRGAAEGSVMCFLNETLEYHPKCTDIDECTENNGGCDDKCTNSPGSHACSCESQAFAPSSPGDTDCIDVDECMEMTAHCNPTNVPGPTDFKFCVNTFGAYECKCPPDYALFTEAEMQGLVIPPTETGDRINDTYRFNHTCVPRACPALPALNPAEAVLMSNKPAFYHGDEVDIDCKIGFKKADPLALPVDSDITYRLSCDNGVWIGEFKGCDSATCTIPAYGDFTFPPSITRFALGDTIDYLDAFDVNQCNRGAVNPDDNTQPTYHLSRDIEDLFTIKVTCIYDPQADTYTLDRASSMDCLLYVNQTYCGPPPPSAGARYLVSEGGSEIDVTDITTITFNSRVYFGCETEGKTRGENGGIIRPGVGNPFFQCLEDEKWSLGSLFCEESLCEDPGRIADAEQVIEDVNGVRLPDQSYQVTTYVRYACNRTGYWPEPSERMQCVENATGSAVWEGTLPTCVDKEAPVILNCPTDTVWHDPYMPTYMPALMVTDNSGANQDSLRVQVVPEGYSRTTPIAPRGNPAGIDDFGVNITYTDLAGNSASCAFRVQSRDKVSPIITCPTTHRIKITQETPMDFPTPVATATDAISTNVTVVTVPDVVTGLTPSDVGSFILFSATATDDFGNNASCSYIVQVESEPCAPWALPEIANGTKTDRMVGTGWEIDYTCSPGYAFYDNPEEGAVITYTCTGPDTQFTPSDIPFCQPSEQSVWLYTVDVLYCNWDGVPVTLTDPYCQQQYENELKDRARADAAGQLWNSCMNYGFTGPRLIELVDTYVTSSVVDEASCPGGKALELKWRFQQLLDPTVTWIRDVAGGEQTASYFWDAECRFGAFDAQLGTRLQNRFMTMRFVPENGNCSRLAAAPTGGNALDTVYYDELSGFRCDEYDKLFTTNLDPATNESTPNSEVFCYGCTAGEYSEFVNVNGNGRWTCLPTPIGTYKSEAGAMSSCPGNKTCLYGLPCNNDESDYIIYCHCPEGTNTFRTGATDVSYCKEKCINQGLVSRTPDGLSPCDSCPPGTFAYNDTWCEACPAGTHTGSVGGRSMADCLQQCPPGHFSNNGYEPPNGACTKCPLGFYQENSAQTDCMECAGDHTTLTEGSTNISACITGAAAGCDATTGCNGQGSCSIHMHEKICTCTDKYGGADCSEDFLYCASTPCAYDSGCALVPGDTQVDGRWYSCNCGASTITDLTGPHCENEPDDRGNLECRFSDARGSPRDLIGGADCNCKAGFQGANCELATNACDVNPCNAATTVMCHDFTVRYMCECIDGYSGQDCTININECFSSPCGLGSCEDGIAGYRCLCPEGTTGDACETIIDPCAPINPCGANAECRPNKLDFLCLCDDGYEPAPGESADRPGGGVATGPCVETINCDGVTCNNRGTCGELLATYNCDCNDGFTGRDCQHNVDDCLAMPCVNGECIDGDDAYTCNCDQGYTGQNCDMVIDMCIPTSPCNASNTMPGGCSMDESVKPPQVLCDCVNGYVGQYCDTDFDDCVLGENQCYHDGTCDDLVGDYMCNCAPGWEGKRCEDQINDCIGDPCLNGGTCYDLHLDFRCVCPPSFAGKDCNSTTDICRDVKPCYEGSTCLLDEFSGNNSCVCQPDRTGENCELLIDGCLNNPCLNGGTCSYNSTSPYGFSCACVQGFGGPICNDTIDYCADVTCPPNTPCINVPSEQRGICYCIGLLAPAACTKPQDLEKDIYFGSADLNNFADASWYAMRLGVDGHLDFSLGFWFRYSRNGGTGNILTLYTERDPIPLETDHWIIRFDDGQMYLNNYESASVTTIPYVGAFGESYVVNDGEWIYMAITYDHSKSELTLYAETVNVNADPLIDGKNVQFNMPNEQFNYANIVLGYFEDPETGVNSTFEGFASHVCLWNRILQGNEIQLLTFDRQKVQDLTNLLSGCMEFTPQNGARVYRDTNGESDAGDPVNLASGGVEPSLKGCPTEPQVVNGNVRPIQVLLTEIEAANGNLDIHAEYNGDVYLVNGTYTNVVIGVERSNGKTATCYYDIVINAYSCTDPERIVQLPTGTTDGDIEQARPGANHRIPMSCPGARKFSQPVPSFFTCPKQQAFNTWNQYEKFFSPQCSDTFDAVFDLLLIYEMPAILPCTAVQNISGITKDVLSKMQILNEQWDNPDTNKPAFCPDAPCEEATSDIVKHTMVCLKDAVRRRKRATQSDEEGLQATLALTNLPLLLESTATGPGGTINTLDLLWNYFIGLNNIYTENVLGSALDPEGTQFDVQYKCSMGQELVYDGEFDNGRPRYFCVNCAAGEYWEEYDNYETAKSPEEYKWGKCYIVPEGYFNPDEAVIGLENVPQCPGGQTTEEPGAMDVSQCKEGAVGGVVCPEGSYINEVNLACEKCHIGFFQPEAGKFFCWPCPPDKSTALVGTKLLSECKDACPLGTELIRDPNTEVSTCKPCAKGFIREDLLTPNCVACIDADFTTAGEDGDNLAEYHNSDEFDCIIRDCMLGYEIDAGSPTGCKICPLDYYQDKRAQEDCIRCPNGLDTQFEGSTTVDDCQLFCDAGFETGGANNSVCVECAVGSYKELPGIASCDPCEDGKTTAGTGSTTMGACSITSCDAGEKVDLTSNTCVNCSRGEYHPEPFTTRDPAERDQCLPCPNDNNGDPQTTIHTGSTDLSDCVKRCPSGEELDLGTMLCIPCGDVKYRTDTDDGPFFCLPCPTMPNPTRRPVPDTPGYVIEECSLGDCPAGQYADGTLCRLCPDATYNPLPRQNGSSACMPCTCADIPSAGDDCKDEELTTGGAGQGLAITDCQNVCEGRCTNPGESCMPSDTDPDGYECMCRDNFIFHGGECRHRCEANWCYDRGTQFCIRDPEDDTLAICRCEELYEGLQCDVRKDPQGETQFIIGGAIGAVVLVLLMLLLFLWICWCFKKDKNRVKKEPTVAPTVYQPYPVAVYDSLPFQSKPPQAGTLAGSYGRNMYYPPMSGFHDNQSMTGYNTAPDPNVYGAPDRVYGTQMATQQFYEDPDDGPVNLNDYSTRLPNDNPYQGAAAFSEGGLYAEVNKMM